VGQQVVGRRSVRGAVAVAGIAVLALLAGCQSSLDGGASAASASKSKAGPPATLQLTPADGTPDVSPSSPVQVAVAGGELGKVTVADAAGAAVAGAVAASPDAPGTSVWTPEKPLAYGTTYTVTATAQNPSDTAAKATTTFTTVKPATLSTPSVGPLNGTTVGVGMPIRVYFDQKIDDDHKAAVEKQLKVDTSKPTDGSWNWLSDKEVHFRPSTYWPAGTDVTLHADLYGIDLGNGVWGEKNRTVAFHVGDKHVSVADADTHTLTVSDGDKVVQTYPMSAGSDANPTHNGPHVVLQTYDAITMDSSTFGLAVDAPGGYRADVKFATRISNNGEFVHGAPWSAAQQGHANVSHGCINLTDERAQWFLNFSKPGDVVEIKNSKGPLLSAADGDIYDWAISWDQWKAGSALS
jgi:lipoprotein-anchoring transpeptidase ErfK/SrfK